MGITRWPQTSLSNLNIHLSLKSTNSHKFHFRNIREQTAAEIKNKHTNTQKVNTMFKRTNTDLKNSELAAVISNADSGKLSYFVVVIRYDCYHVYLWTLTYTYACFYSLFHFKSFRARNKEEKARCHSIQSHLPQKRSPPLDGKTHVLSERQCCPWCPLLARGGHLVFI